MKCPNCGGMMKEIRSLQGQGFFCSNCGLKKGTTPEEDKPILFPPLELANRSKKSKKATSVSRVKERVEEAQIYSELRQVAKELAGRINDLEIQMERRIEEFQSLVMRIEKIIQKKSDS